MEGLVYPRGEAGRERPRREGERERDGWREAGREGGGRQRHVDRQECGLWKYELIFFFSFLPLRRGRIESSKENRLQAGWHAGVVLGKCEVRGACSLFLFLSLRPSSLFSLPLPPPTPHPLSLRRPLGP